ncbi:hypothetical protein C8R44DRAFT_749112 [Mycena epipterygia]|nr:hypothetical protein C8R44DRAFT_749112 [Mycena epipterygia]
MAAITHKLMSSLVSKRGAPAFHIFPLGSFENSYIPTYIKLLGMLRSDGLSNIPADYNAKDLSIEPTSRSYRIFVSLVAFAVVGLGGSYRTIDGNRWLASLAVTPFLKNEWDSKPTVSAGVGKNRETGRDSKGIDKNCRRNKSPLSRPSQHQDEFFANARAMFPARLSGTEYSRDPKIIILIRTKNTNLDLPQKCNPSVRTGYVRARN